MLNRLKMYLFIHFYEDIHFTTNQKTQDVYAKCINRFQFSTVIISQLFSKGYNNLQICRIIVFAY